MALRKRLKTSASAGTDVESEVTYDTETIAVDDAERHSAEYSSAPEDAVRKAEKMERDLREAINRTSLAMTDARVALDKAEKSQETIEDIVGRLERVIEATENIQAEHEEYAEALSNLEVLIEDANTKIAAINTRISDIEDLLGELRASVAAIPRPGAEEKSAGIASVKAIEEKLSEFERNYENMRRTLPDTGTLESRFAEFQRRYDERMQSASMDLRLQLDEIRRLQMEGISGPRKAEPEEEAPPETSELAVDLNDILLVMIRHDAPDLHLKVGVPPTVRMGGELIPVGNQILTERDCRRLILGAMTGAQRRKLAQGHEVNLTYVLDDNCFRVNAYLQRGTVSATFRMVRKTIPPIEDLALPVPIEKLGVLSKGLVLVTGLAGSGKSTTMASIINYINMTRKVHIVTVEEPIRFIHSDNESIVTQREVGTDTQSFGEALRQAQRQDPDVLLISELREPEIILEAVRAADMGRLVIAGMYSPNTIATLKRLIGSFPGDQQHQFCLLLSSTLRGVLSQKLLNRADEQGRIPAVEYLQITPAVAALIAENRLGDVYPHLADEDNPGMRTFTASITELVEAGYVTEEEAERHADRTGEGRVRVRRHIAVQGAQAQKTVHPPTTQPASGLYAGPQDYLIAALEEMPGAEESDLVEGSYSDYDSYRTGAVSTYAPHPDAGSAYFGEERAQAERPYSAAFQEGATYEAPQAKDIIASAIRGARASAPGQAPSSATEQSARRLASPGDPSQPQSLPSLSPGPVPGQAPSPSKPAPGGHQATPRPIEHRQAPQEPSQPAPADAVRDSSVSTILDWL